MFRRQTDARSHNPSTLLARKSRIERFSRCFPRFLPLNAGVLSSMHSALLKVFRRARTNHARFAAASALRHEPLEAKLLLATDVVGQHVFYNDSAFDGDAVISASDDLAIATDKSALLPGDTATFANYTSYSRGINGIMVDVTEWASLPTLGTVGDFFSFSVGNDDTPSAWPAAADPIDVAVRAGEGSGGSDRVTIIWADNAIEQTWLEITAKSGEATGLAADKVFYIGNAIAETGDSSANAEVNGFDIAGTQDNPRDLLDPASIDDAFDFNRDKEVNGFDIVLAQDNPTDALNGLNLISPPALNNLPVVATAIDDQSNNDSDAVSLDVSTSFSDPDLDTLTFTATGLPTGLAIDSATGVIGGTIDSSASQGSPYVATVTADDGNGGMVSESFNWAIANLEPSSISPIDDVSSLDGDAVNLDLSVNFNDPDGDTLTFSAIGLPAGLSMDAAGVVSGTLAADASASSPYVVNVSVSDGDGGIEGDAFVWAVTNPAPAINVPDQTNNDLETIAALNLLSFITDDEAFTLTEVTGLPASLSVDLTTGEVTTEEVTIGEVTGTLDGSASQGGTDGVYSVAVTAEDAEGDSSTVNFNWTVLNPVPTVTGSIADQSSSDSQTIAALDVSAAFTDGDMEAMTFSASGLPGGLSMSAAGVISGTIDANASDSSPYNVEVTATDTDGDSSVPPLSFNWTVGDPGPIVLLPIPTQTATDGEAYSLDTSLHLIDPSGDSLTYSATGLPASLTIDPSTGVIDGTLAVDESTDSPYTVAVTATDGSSSASDTFTLTVANPLPAIPALADQTNADGETGISLDVSLGVTDEDPTLTFSATGLPSGLSIDPAGLITGDLADNASVGSPHTVAITATDTDGGSTSASFTWTVTNPVPTIVAPIANTANNDGETIADLDISGAFADDDPLTYSAANLPAGLSLDSVTGVISGTIDPGASGDAPAFTAPTGTYIVTITVDDGAGGSVSDSFNWDVTNLLPSLDGDQVNLGPDPEGTVISLDLSGNFSDPDGDDLIFLATNLPDGLSIDASTGVISGTIAATATGLAPSKIFNVSVSADDGDGGVTAADTFDWEVTNSGPMITTVDQTNTDLDVVSLNLNDFVVDDDPVTITLTSALPSSLSIDAAGVITGTLDHDASELSPYTVTFTASDGAFTESGSFTWTVNNPAPVEDAVTPDQSGNDGDVIVLDVSGNFSDPDGDTLTFSATGLPTGLSISAGGIISGTIAGTASANAPYTVTLSVNDGVDTTSGTPFGWSLSNVDPVLVAEIADQASSDAEVVNLDVSSNFSDPDGTMLQFTATGLPASLTISAGGVISGTLDSDASQGSVYTVTVTADDTQGISVSDTFEWTVSNVNPVQNLAIDSESNNDGDTIAEKDISMVDLDDMDDMLNPIFSDPDGDSLTYSAANLPPGLSISPDGKINGTIDPGASGSTGATTYSVSITATDSDGGSFTGTFDWDVANIDPTVGFLGDMTSEDDETISPIDLSTAFTDPDGDVLTITATGLPTSLSITPAGVVFGTVDSNASASSPYNVMVTADDGNSGVAMTSFTWTINNDGPDSTPIADQSNADADTEISLDISGNFSDEDTLTFSASGLPDNLTIDASTGVISGDIDSSASQDGPMSDGVYNVSVTAHDGTSGTTESFTWTVTNVAPALDTAAGPQSASDGQAFSLDLSGNFSDAVDMDTPLVFSATGLPVNLSISAGGVISGTIDSSASQGGPNSDGVYPVVVTVTDNDGGTATDSFDITVTNVAPTNSGIADQTATDGEVISLDAATVGGFADGDSDALTFSVSGLPASLSMDAAGLITGTLTASDSQNSPYNVSVTADDGEGDSTTASFNWTVTNVDPTTSGIADQASTDGETISLDVSGSFADGAPDSDTLTYSASGLPAGLSIDSATGVVSGDVDSGASQVGGGSYAVTVSASDGTASVDASFTWTVTNAAPTTTGVSDQASDDGEAISLDISGSFADGSPDSDTLAFSSTGLPAGLSIDAGTGVISGTIGSDASQGGPNTDGVYNVTVTVDDGDGGSETAAFDWTVSNPGPVATTIADQASNDGEAIATLNVAGNFSDPDGDTPLTFAATGLPGGLSIDLNTGDITGTIAADASAGSVYSVVVTATDAEGGTGSTTFSWTVNNVDPTTSGIADQSSNDGDAINLDVSGSFSDGAPDSDALTYSAAGLPAGLSIDANSGVISGNLAADASQTDDGSYAVTVTASDGTTSVDASFSWTVTNPGPVVVSAIPTQTNDEGDSPSLDLSAFFSDGATDSDDLSYTITTALPDGLSIDSDTGVISGTLSSTSAGSYIVSVEVSDGQGGLVTETFTWNVNDV